MEKDLLLATGKYQIPIGLFHIQCPQIKDTWILFDSENPCKFICTFGMGIFACMLSLKCTLRSIKFKKEKWYIWGHANIKSLSIFSEVYDCQLFKICSVCIYFWYSFMCFRLKYSCLRRSVQIFIRKQRDSIKVENREIKLTDIKCFLNKTG